MAQMRPAVGASDLGPSHAVAAIVFGCNGVLRNRCRKTGPARSRIELITGRKQIFAADYAVVHAVFVVVPVGTGKWGFRSLFLRHVAFHLGQFGDVVLGGGGHALSVHLFSYL